MIKETEDFKARLMGIALDITLPENYNILIKQDAEIPNGRLYFQIECWREDAITGEMGYGYGGKAYLSPHASTSELVQTIFGLYKGYVEHEAREFFKYKGRRIFGPHMSVEALHEIANRVDVRSVKHVEDTPKIIAID